MLIGRNAKEAHGQRKFGHPCLRIYKRLQALTLSLLLRGPLKVCGPFSYTICQLVERLWLRSVGLLPRSWPANLV